MPNIVEYNNPVDGIKPSDRGIEAEVQAGRRIGSFFHQAGEDIGGGVAAVGDAYNQHVDEQQMMTYTAARSQIDLGLMQKWNAYAADPKNQSPTMAQDFTNNVVRPAYDELTSHISNPKLQATLSDQATDRVTTLGLHFMADQSTIDGARTVQAAGEIVNGVGAQTSLGMDVQSAISQGKKDVDTMGALIQDPGKRAIFTEEHYAIVEKSAIIGHFSSLLHSDNPQALDQAESELQSQKYGTIMSPEQTSVLLNEVHTQRDALKTQQNAATSAQRKALEDEGHAAFTNIAVGMTDPTTGLFTVTPQIVQAARAAALKYGGVDPGGAKALLDSVQEAQRRQASGENVIDDPKTYTALMQNPQLTREDVAQAYQAGRLSNTSFTRLNEVAEGLKVGANPQVEEGMKLFVKQEEALKGSITKSGTLDMTSGTPGVLASDASGDQNYAQFVAYNRVHLDALTKEYGGDRLKAIRFMTDPASPDYVGRFAAQWAPGGKYAAVGPYIANKAANAPSPPPNDTKTPALTPDQQTWIANRHKGGQ